jgi:hypothetical protein
VKFAQIQAVLEDVRRQEQPGADAANTKPD